MIGATGPRASETISERVSEREGSQRFLEVFRCFQRFSELAFQRFSEVFRGPLRDPLRGRFPSQKLSVLLPLIVLPLELSPNMPSCAPSRSLASSCSSTKVSSLLHRRQNKNKAVQQQLSQRHRFQRAPNPPEFAQPRLSRVKRRSSPARGYKFECVCSK